MARLTLLLLLAIVACRRQNAPPPAARPAATPSTPALAPVVAPDAARATLPVLLHAKLPDAPGTRPAKYRGPVDELLRARHLGSVVGWGTITDRDKHVVYVSLDLEVTDVSEALSAVRAKLRDLGAPQGSVVEQSGAEGTTVAHPVW